MFAIIIVGVINFAAEHAGDIEQFVTPKSKEENSHIIDIPPQEDNKPIIEKPTPVPQKPSVTDIPSGDVEEKELGHEIFPKTPADEDKPKITTAQGNGNSNYQAPKGGGGVTDQIEVGDQTVTFGHGGRHLDGTKLDMQDVNQALAEDVAANKQEVGQFQKRRITVDGQIIEYTSYRISDERIHIGTYYPVPK